MDTALVTGASGLIGSEVVRHMNDHGCHTVNVDRAPGTGEADTAIEADLTDAGEVYGAFARAEPDVVAHMGAIPNAGGHPDHVVYGNNAMGAYHVLEAASALGIDSVCLASSIMAMGITRPIEVTYLPVDEDHPLAPMDPYELGKRTVETLADGFARRPGAPGTISTLRFPLVRGREAFRERYPEGDGTVDSLGAEGRDQLFSYALADDVADLVKRALEGDFEGHERFWASAPDTRTEVPTAELITEFYPNADVRSDLSGNDPLIDTSKARELLGWEPEVSWRDL